MKKKILIIFIILYSLFSFRFMLTQNGDIYLRIVPIEKIQYIFVPLELKKAYRNYEAQNSICKILTFSKKRIIFLCDKKVRELIYEDGNISNRVYIPECKYELTDRLKVEISQECYSFVNMIRFFVVENDKEIYSSYFIIYDKKELEAKNEKELMEILLEHQDSEIVIEDCLVIS